MKGVETGDTTMTGWLKAGMVMALVAIGVVGEAYGADKARDTARRDSAANAANASLRTQQRTSDSFANKLSGKATSQPSKSGKPSSNDELKAELAALEARIKAEDQRYADSMTDLRAAEDAANQSGKAKSVASAKKAINRAQSSYDKKVGSLNAQREKLRKKLGVTADEAAKPAAAMEAKDAKAPETKPAPAR